ncbi:MAG: peptidase [Cryobacterium sp.]|jgi:hypothetical protein|nr:peptidase [Cryobacterium sp.]
MNGRRVKLGLILLVLLASAVALLAWTRVWIDASVLAMGAGSAPQHLEVAGANAAPALTALALAGLSLAGALTIAGRVIRVVLGLLAVLLGISVFLAAFFAVTDPARASASTVTAATGIAGNESILVGVADASLTPWPFVALGSGVAIAVAGIAILLTAKHWPGSTSRYSAVRLAPAGTSDSTPGSATQNPVAPAGQATAGEDPGAARSNSVDSWDDLSRGADPTA